MRPRLPRFPRVPLRVVAGAAVALLTACLEVNAPPRRLLSARLLSDGIELLNLSDKTIYTFAADPDTLAVLDWTPCSVPESCGGIPAGEARQTPFDEIEGYSEFSRDVVVLHWHLVADGEVFKPDTVRGLLLRLR